MDNYKGIYYNATNEQKSFEGGAHFRYNDLYRALSALVSLLPPERTNTCDDNKDNTQDNKEQDVRTEMNHHVIKVEEVVQTEIKVDDKAEVKSRNKQNVNNLFQGISVTAVNAGPGPNTQIVLSGNNTTINVLNSNNTTSDPVVANGNLHCRQKSENNNNNVNNNLNLNGFSTKLTTCSNGNSNNNKCKSNSKNENTKTKIRIHSASPSNNNNNCSSNNNNEHNKLKPKKIDPIQPKCVSKHKKVNVKPVTSQYKKHSNNNNTNTMLLMLNKYRNNNNNHHQHQHTRHLSENKNDMSGHHNNTNCLNKSVNNPKSRNVNNNNNNVNHIGISSLNNKIKKISHLTVNDINSNNNNKNSRNKKHNIQCNSLYGLLTFNKTTSNIIGTKKSKGVKYKNGVCNGGIGGNCNAVNFADLFIKKKDVGTKKH